MAKQLDAIDDSQRRAATVVGLAYLIPFAIIVYANFGIRARFMAGGNAAETIRRIAESERTFRISIACDLVYCVGVVVLIAALYVVFKPVNPHLALLAALLRLVYALTAVLITLNFLTVLRVSSGADFARAFQAEPLQALVRLSSGTRGDQYYVGLAFWAVASAVCSYLWLAARYIPRALAVFGLVASVWCALCTFAYLIEPAVTTIVNLWWFDSPMGVFEIATGFWLLFKGLPRP
jgi:hypothetical protein